MPNSSSPLQNTLENVTPLVFHFTKLIRWKNNGVTFSNVFCNGELEFAIIFCFFFALKSQNYAAGEVKIGGSGGADKLPRLRPKIRKNLRQQCDFSAMHTSTNNPLPS